MGGERKLIEEARRRAESARSHDAGVLIALGAALEAVLAREQRKDEALESASRDLLPAINSGQPSATRVVTWKTVRLIREALAAVPVETQKAAPDDYSRPGWRMFPIF